jgi:hypothetical protein
MTPSDTAPAVLFLSADKLEWGEQYTVAQDLADSFQATIYEPSWPDHATGRSSRLTARSEPSTRNVLGRFGPSPLTGSAGTPRR